MPSFAPNLAGAKSSDTPWVSLLIFSRIRSIFGIYKPRSLFLKAYEIATTTRFSIFNVLNRQGDFPAMVSTLYKCPLPNFYFPPVYSLKIPFVDHLYSSTSQKLIDFRIVCSLCWKVVEERWIFHTFHRKLSYIFLIENCVGESNEKTKLS